MTWFNIVKIDLCKENNVSLELEPFSSLSLIMIDSDRYVQTNHKHHWWKHSSNLENLELQKFCIVLSQIRGEKNEYSIEGEFWVKAIKLKPP